MPPFFIRTWFCPIWSSRWISALEKVCPSGVPSDTESSNQFSPEPCTSTRGRTCAIVSLIFEKRAPSSTFHSRSSAGSVPPRNRRIARSPFSTISPFPSGSENPPALRRSDRRLLGLDIPAARPASRPPPRSGPRSFAAR